MLIQHNIMVVLYYKKKMTHGNNHLKMKPSCIYSKKRQHYIHHIRWVPTPSDVQHHLDHKERKHIVCSTQQQLPGLES